MAVVGRGWAQSLAELVATRGPVLVGYAYLLCGDRREAEDLVQDALVKTFTNARGGTHLENVEGYVRRAILTTYLDGFRRRKRWAALRHLAVAPDAHPDHEGAVGDRLEVRDALAGLSPRERACVVLRFYEDLTVARIADELSLSEGAVKRYLSDGVHRLETTLGPVRTPPAEAIDAADAAVHLVTTGTTRRTR